MNRKPYLIIGLFIYSFSMYSYSFLSNDNIIHLAICLFIGTVGLIMMDVIADTMVCLVIT